MLCKELQTKIAVHDALTPDERDHAASCPDCVAFAAFDSSLGARLADWRAPLVAPRRSPAPIRPVRLAFIGVGLVAALTLGALALPTRSSAREAYRRMLGQVRNVRAIHLVVRWRPGNGNPEDGALRKVSEMWWRPGAWREHYEGSQPTLKRVETDGLKFYRYNASLGRVETYHEAAKPIDHRSFELASFASQYMDTPTHFDQPSPTRIVVSNGGGWSRMVFTLDPSTGLPIHADKQFRRGSEWLKSGELDMEFNDAVPVERFEPKDLMEGPKP